MSHSHVNLANAQDLIAWAERRDSQSVLPRLLRRLVFGSVPAGLTRNEFRADEGVQLGGWDGTTVCGGAHPHVPEGVSGWELSARKDVKTKADEDFANRLENPDGLVPGDTTFIFVTPRRWAGKHQWAAERTAEGTWRAVVVLDADDLEIWLEATPSVHVWFSTYIGKKPEGAVDLETFWADWSHVTDPPMSAALLLAGRTETVEQIQRQLKDGGQASMALKAESPEEALAVFAAAVYALPDPERMACLSRTIITDSPTVLESVSTCPVPLIIIPRFEDPSAISRAIRSGHLIVLPVGKRPAESATTITLPRLSVSAAEAALAADGKSPEQARSLAVLGRRSLMALRRKLALRPEVQQPEWASAGDAHALLPFVLAGAWDEGTEADLAALARLAQDTAEHVQETAARWSREDDPPVRSVGSVWYLVSGEDSWRLLGPALTKADLERFEAVVLFVLGTPDPRLNLPAKDRWMSFDRPAHSASLRHGLAETLAVMGTLGTELERGGATLDQWAARIVRALLKRANADWRVWASISPQLPLLAEAAPRQFLALVDEGLSGEQPLIRLFQQDGDPLFSSSPQTGLLWALERLSWSADHLALASLLLAKLARLDPGGRLANRPRRSLRETFLLWNPQTSAPWVRQIQILKMLIDREPAVGWQLHADLLPRTHDTSLSRTKPEWRDWAPEGEPRLTIGEHVQHLRDLVQQMLSVVGVDGQRWTDLAKSLPELPPDMHEMIVQRLQALDPAGLAPEHREALWAALRDVVAHHRSFPDADWALPRQRVDVLEALFLRFEPSNHGPRFAWLFAHHVRLPDGKRRDWQEEEAAVAKSRQDAIRVIYEHDRTNGVEGVVERVEDAHSLGVAFGASGLGTPDEDALLRRHLASGDRGFRSFARGYLVGGASVRGREWCEGKFRLEGLSALQRAEVLMCLPSEPRTWALAESEPEVEEAFWKNVYPHLRGDAAVIEHATEMLVRYGRAYAAADLIAFRLKDVNAPTPALIVRTLEAALAQRDVDATGSSFSYWLGELLDALTSSPEIDKARVARIEWGFAPILRHDRPLTVLHGELGRSPAFFAELVALIYRREHEAPSQSTDADVNRATVAYSVLDSWRSLPVSAPEGSVSSADLDSWVDRALAATAENGRPTVGAQHVGRVLSHGPVGADGAWPHEAVRHVIERVQNPDVEAGFEMGTMNKRGVVTRALDEGGRQERALADQYAAWAVQCLDRWPRTAAALRRIEASYRGQARREDAETELRDDGMW